MDITNLKFSKLNVLNLTKKSTIKYINYNSYYINCLQNDSTQYLKNSQCPK